MMRRNGFNSFWRGWPPQDFAPVEEGPPHQPFGNYYTTFLHAHLQIRSVKDRDMWRINITDDRQSADKHGFLPWTSIAFLWAVANGVSDEANISPESDTERAVWLLEHLDSIAFLISEATTWQTIHKLQRQSAKRRFGVGLPD